MLFLLILLLIIAVMQRPEDTQFINSSAHQPLIHPLASASSFQNPGIQEFSIHSPILNVIIIRRLHSSHYYPFPVPLTVSSMRRFAGRAGVG